MEQKKVIAITAGVLAAAVLFMVAYSQFTARPAAAPSAPSMTQERAAQSIPATDNGTPEVTVEPNANPASPDTVVAEISKQMDAESAALSADADTEISSIHAEADSLDNLSQSYDENQY